MASPGLIVLGQRDGRVHFVDAFTGARRENLRTHSQSVSCVAISRDGHFIASWSPGGTIKMREASGSIMFDVEQLARVSVMAFSPSSHLLAVGSDRTTVLLRDAKTGKLEWVLQHPFPWATASISFSAERALLATSSDEGQILIWDISEPVPSTGVKTRGMELVRCSIDTTVSGSHPVVFSPDGRTVASASVSSPQRVSTVKIWDADTGKVKKEFAGHRGSILSLCFSPDGSALASGSTDKTVRVWEVESGAQRLCLLGHYSGDGCLCNNGLLNWALHPGFLPQAGFFDLTDAECPVVGHRSSVVSVCFTDAGGRTLVSAERHGTCKVWDSFTGELRKTIVVSSDARSVAIGRDWVRDEKWVAFAMGQHARLGEASWVNELDEGVIQMVLECT